MTKNSMSEFSPGTAALTLRKATVQDAELLFNWANEDVVRSNSIHSKKIIWADHLNWLDLKLSSSNFLLILEVERVPAGQIRFDFDPQENGWVIDYSISPDHRGKGLGKTIVAMGMAYVKKFPVIAYVKLNNGPSIKVFESLQFRRENIYTKNGNDVIKFIKIESS